LKTKLTVVAVVLSCIFGGCAPQAVTPVQPEEGKELLTVDFNEGQILRYRFVSHRDIVLSWGQTTGSRGEKAEDAFSESLEMVMSYKPVKVDRYGLTVIEATCESVKPRRSSKQSKQLRNSKDPVKMLAGKSFSFTVSPTGKIADYSEMDALIREMGKKAFRERSQQGRVKEPDMIGDFIASQWFLWDSISSIKNPLKGVAPGDSWTSVLSVPSPLVMRKARNVTYKFAAVRKSHGNRFALIRSSYSPAKSVPDDWCKPYPPGGFQVSGSFGLLRRLTIDKLEGTGEELFNIDSGRIEKYTQKFNMEVAATLLFPLPGANPRVKIEQELTMQLLGQ